MHNYMLICGFPFRDLVKFVVKYVRPGEGLAKAYVRFGEWTVDFSFVTLNTPVQLHVQDNTHMVDGVLYGNGRVVTLFDDVRGDILLDDGRV